jgi:hypothetical protein
MEWLEIKSISCLDRALCESAKRKIFLEVLNGLTISGLVIEIVGLHNDMDNTDDYNVVSDFYLQWISKRNIFIKNLLLLKWDIVIKHYYNFSQLEKIVIDFSFMKNDFEGGGVNFRILLKYCLNLKDLSIQKSRDIDQSHLAKILDCFNNIKILSIKDFSKFDDRCLSLLSNYSYNITKISLIDLQKITYTSFSEFFKSFVNLKELTIEDCVNFTDDCLIAISKYCKNLEFLELINLQNITDEGLLAYENGFFKLKIFKISHCYNIKNFCNDKKIKNNLVIKYC